MKISIEWLGLGALVGAGAYYYYTRNNVANAFALGQANPTVSGFTGLTPAQQAQVSQNPPLPSPPPLATTLASATNTVGSAVTNAGQQIGQQLGTSGYSRGAFGNLLVQ